MTESQEQGENRNLVEAILLRIPGFRGYLQKQDRRQSDRLQREWLVDRLQRAKPAIDDLAQPLGNAGLVDMLPQLDRLRARMDKVVWQISGQASDDSGFFDMERIDSKSLDRVYEHDMALIDRVEALAEAVESLPSDPDQIGLELPSAFDAVDAIERELEIRAEMRRRLT